MKVFFTIPAQRGGYPGCISGFPPKKCGKDGRETFIFLLWLLEPWLLVAIFVGNQQKEDKK